MGKKKSDISRRNRIEYEVIVDCYDEYEMAMGWFYYLNDNLKFPFKASIVGDIKIDSLQEGDSIIVTEFINSSKDDVSMYNFLPTVWIEKGEHIYDIPLVNVKSVDCDDDTFNTIEDWRYWCEKF